MKKSSVPITERRYVVPLTMVTSLFFLWALGVNLNDILIPHLKKAFGLSGYGEPERFSMDLRAGARNAVLRSVRCQRSGLAQPGGATAGIIGGCGR